MPLRKLPRPGGVGAGAVVPLDEPKALKEYLRNGRVGWTESIPHTKPECPNRCKSMVTLQGTTEGNHYRFWVCWGCGNLIYDDKPEYRNRSIDEQNELTSAIKVYLSHLTPEQELCLYRHATSSDLGAWEQRQECFE